MGGGPTSGVRCGYVAIAHLERWIPVVELVREERRARARLTPEVEVGKSAREFSAPIEEECADEGEEEEPSSKGATERDIATFVVV